MYLIVFIIKLASDCKRNFFVRSSYRITRIPIQAISFVVLGLILWEAVHDGERIRKFIIHGEEYTIFVAIYVIVLNFVFLLILCTMIYNGEFRDCDWLSMVNQSLNNRAYISHIESD